jgi:hypothetical protein
LLQTAKNLDKALGRILDAGGANLASRLERDSSHRNARAKAEGRVIHASGKCLAGQIADQGSIVDRALNFSFGDSILKQANRENIARIAIEDMRSNATGSSTDATAEIDDDWLNSFSDLSSSKSDLDIQSLWGRILSG